jgi:hypothetical protein
MTRERRGDAAERAAGLAQRWVAAYTRGLPPAVGERRRAELASDLWEQRAAGRAAGTPPRVVGRSIVWRTMVGAPADLRWRRRQLTAPRGWQPASAPAPRRLPAWVVLAAVVAIFQIAGGLQSALLPVNRSVAGAAGALAVVGTGVLLLVGIAHRRRSRAAGDALVAAGALAVLPWAWLVVPAAGLPLLLVAVVDAADARGWGRVATFCAVSAALAAALLVLAVALLRLQWTGWLSGLPVVLGLLAHQRSVRRLRRPA